MDLLSDLLVPCVAPTQFVLVEPDFDAIDPKRVRNAPSTVGTEVQNPLKLCGLTASPAELCVRDRAIRESPALRADCAPRRGSFLAGETPGPANWADSSVECRFFLVGAKGLASFFLRPSP